MQGKVAIYSRKSRYTGVGESIENQAEMCRQFVRLHYGEEAAEGCRIFEDEGFSGGNLERPQFQKMMAEARSGSLQAIVCYRLDRVSRNIGDFARLIEELEHLGVAFISIKEQFDTGSPMGRAMMYISSVFSQLERETIAERIRDNMRELAKTGRWLGGNTPLGYGSETVVRVTEEGRRKKACRLKEIPEERQTVECLFAYFLKTGSLAETERQAERQGLRTRQGKPFTRYALRDILQNPVYARADADTYRYFAEQGAVIYGSPKEYDGSRGLMVYNRTIQKKGKAHKERPVTEWLIARGHQEGFLSGADWVRTQEVFQRNRQRGMGEHSK